MGQDIHSLRLESSNPFSVTTFAAPGLKELAQAGSSEVLLVCILVGTSRFW